MKVDGKKIAKKIVDELKKIPVPDKRLAVILIGDDLATSLFVKVKQKMAEDLGVDFELKRFKKNISQKELEDCVKLMVSQNDIGGILIQLPLSAGINRDELITKLDFKKDVDNLTDRALVESPAVLAVKDILKEANFDLEGKMVAVVGAEGFLIGKPVSRWLADLRFKINDLRVKEIDVETRDLQEALKDVDLVISGVGKKGLINPEWLKEGAGVIDFGYPPDLGNSKFKIQNSKLNFYTPTPGGTGPVLVAELFKNFYKLNGKI